MKRVVILAAVVLALALSVGRPASGTASITVTSLGPMAQLNTGGLPGTYIREFSTIWDVNDPNTGTIFFVDSSSSPRVIKRATSSDAGLTWTAGAGTGLTNPVGAADPDQRNPVVRDFDLTGDLLGFFGTKQGVYGGGNDANNVFFRASSADNGTSWSGESLVTFGPSPQTLGHTGMNGFIEVFRTSGGDLRAYTAMNNITGSPLSATRLVESSDGGATWTDVGNILIDGRNNVVGANGPVFTFTDVDDGQTKMGWFMFGESAHRGVHLMISTDEGLTWTAHPALSVADNTIRSGDANFISDSLVRLFYYRNVSGGSPSDRQLWYEDFALTGMTDIQPNNLFGPEAPPAPDHFLFYKTKFERVVHLEDQFEAGFFEIEKEEEFGVPADKNGEGIRDDQTHLQAFKIKPAKGQPEHEKVEGIRVENQFGKYQLYDTEKAERLLVPTAKSEDGPVPAPNLDDITLDHFKCYSVKESEGFEFPDDITVMLADQFTEGPKQFEVKKPTELCVPVDKNGEGIKNPDGHLMCYEIKPASEEPKFEKVDGVWLNNQFGPGVAEVEKEEELCVPSQKSLPEP